MNIIAIPREQIKARKVDVPYNLTGYFITDGKNRGIITDDSTAGVSIKSITEKTINDEEIIKVVKEKYGLDLDVRIIITMPLDTKKDLYLISSAKGRD